MITLEQRFQVIKVKDTPVKLGMPASDDELANQFQYVAFIDPSRKLSISLEPTVTLRVFQVKKCEVLNYYYCSRHPIQQLQEVFEFLHFLPLLLLDSTKQHIKDLHREYPLKVDTSS